MTEYGFVKKVNGSFEVVCEVLPDILQREGFGIITRIPLHEKLREKLGVTVNRYLILGACNPANAHKAITIEQNIGLMLPCNVIVYEKEGATWIGVIKPSGMMSMIGNDELTALAAEVEQKLKRVFDSIT
jgi:uncharacterized protein (DUF302 family)